MKPSRRGIFGLIVGTLVATKVKAEPVKTEHRIVGKRGQITIDEVYRIEWPMKPVRYGWDENGRPIHLPPLLGDCNEGHP